MKNYFPKNNAAGFTLIELLVVFSVATILMGIGFVSFVSYSRSQEINQVSLNIKLMLQQARFNSLSSVKSIAGPNGTVLNCGVDALVGYRVIFSTGNDDVRMYILCGATTPRLVRTITLPTGLSLETVSGKTLCSQVQFQSLSARAQGVPCSILIRGFQAQKELTIDLGGNVNLQ